MARTTSPSGQTVATLVRAALGKRASGLGKDELERLAREFVAAGRHAVQAEAGTARQAAEAIEASRKLRGQARSALASRTVPGDPGVLLESEWRDADRALQEHRRRLKGYAGVVGYGLSARRRAGWERAERCVTVLVSEKLTPDKLRRRGRRALPKTLRTSSGKRVPVDVVQVSPLRRQVVAGSSLGPPQTLIKGTIGAFAVDNGSGEMVALTAMHVARGHSAFVVPSPRDGAAGVPLGRFLDGTVKRVDAAKISVEPPMVAEPFLPGIGAVRGWRPVTMPGDRGVGVRLFGATSGRRRGFIAEPAMELPGEGLEQVILVDIHTAEGDSGCGIVDADNLLLGLLIGEIDIDGFTLRAFSPMSLVLEELECDIPSS